MTEPPREPSTWPIWWRKSEQLRHRLHGLPTPVGLAVLLVTLTIVVLVMALSLRW
jgi:hypothetical protein